MKRHATLAEDVIHAAMNGELDKFWKQLSPDRKIEFPWDPVEILPKKEPENMSRTIEIIGPSGAGKTQLVDHLIQKYGADNNLIIAPELCVPHESGEIVDWNKDHKIRGIMQAELGARHQTLIWDVIKVMAHAF